MRQNKVSPGENSPSASASIWTIPIPSVTQSLSNNDEDLPSYDKFIASSARQLDDLPPNYFDISLIPNGAVSYYTEIIPDTEASKAKIERKNGSIISFDPLIDKNTDQLWLYFMTYLYENPSLFVNIQGHHIQSDPLARLYPTLNDRYRSYRYNRPQLVSDFDYSIDLTPYVSKHCWRIGVIPLKKTMDINETISFRDVLEEYTHSKKNFKEIQCQKQLIGWNFEELKYRIRALISSTGYRGDTCIKFSGDNQRIIARSSSKLNRFANSIWTRILCFLSCFWLIFAPIYLYSRAADSTRHQIAADYRMLSSPNRFLRLNTRVILNAVLTHSKRRYLAKIV